MSSPRRSFAASTFMMRPRAIPISPSGAYLADRAAIGARLTVILDDAQEMSDEIMANLAVFLEFKSVAENGTVPKGEGIVEFILVGDEELGGRLAWREFAATAEAVSHRCELGAFSKDEARVFLRQCLIAREIPVSEDAVVRADRTFPARKPAPVEPGCPGEYRGRRWCRWPSCTMAGSASARCPLGGKSRAGAGFRPWPDHGLTLACRSASHRCDVGIFLFLSGGKSCYLPDTGSVAQLVRASGS